MLGSTLATVPGATVDWYCKGLMTFPRLLLGTKRSVSQFAIFQCLFEKLVVHMNNVYVDDQLPSLLLSVHIQTVDSGAVPHVRATSTFRPICEIHIQLLINLSNNTQLFLDQNSFSKGVNLFLFLHKI